MTTTYTAARAKRLILDKKEFPADAEVTGDLDLSGCDLSGVTLPTTIGGGLYLSGCDLSGVTNWFTLNGEATRRRCIAVSDYALIQTDTGQYSAGCRGPWTKAQALEHWGRSGRKDARAKMFVAAIDAHHAVEPA